MNLFFTNTLLIFSFLVNHLNCRIIRTSKGELNGDEIGTFHMFKKVPFAKPPIGKLRFQRPQPADKWNGVWDATEYGPACMSNSSSTSSPQKWIDEDCLHLNVFTNEHCLTSKDCAVVIYLHGGGLEYDSSVMFNDTIIREAFVDHDVIMVIPGMRLGIFSHFVVQNQSIAPSNVALYDILLALEYVKDEIQNFGGNPKKVTVMGHSYGGSVAAMMHFSPKINMDHSLFQQTIIMSSGHDFDFLESQIERARRFGEHSGCLPSKGIMTTDEEDLYILNCLLEKNGTELLRVQRELEDQGYIGFNSIILRDPLFEEIPHSEFMNSPKNMSMMIGCTRYEHDHEGGYYYIGESLNYENKKQVELRYQSDRKNGKYDFQNHADETEAIFVHTKYRVNKMVENGVPVYLYEYTYPKHARHTDDIFYLMGVHRFEMDENERHLKEVYHQIFTDFIKFGNPGFNQSNGDTYFEVFWNQTTRPHMESHFEQNIIDYWFKDMVEYDKNVTAARQLSQRSLQLPPDLENNLQFFRFFSIFLVFLIFLFGCIVGRCCFPRKKNYYIRLDGSDYQNNPQKVY